MAEPTSPASDPRLGRTRAAVLASLAFSVAATVFLAGIGVAREPRLVWALLGVLGILAVATTQAGAFYAAATPRLADRTRCRLLAAFAAAALVSVPVVGPVGSGGADGWASWAWIGAAIVASAPLLTGWRAALVVAALTTGVAAAVGAWISDSPVQYALITAGIGVSLLAVHGLPVQLWKLVLEARDGRDALARLAVTEERLRFARDVHDLLGHHLSVIALKAELAQRLADVDAERAGREAGEARALAAAALAEMRAAVHGYRTVDLDAQLAAIAQVLRSSGVRCTITASPLDLPPAAAAALAATVREASTNVLRHSRARWCTIEVVHDDGEVRMSVANDGAGAARPDAHSSGLRGLAERLAAGGGTLRTYTAAGVFTLEASVPVR